MTQYLAQDPPIENHWFKPSPAKQITSEHILTAMSNASGIYLTDLIQYKQTDCVH